MVLATLSSGALLSRHAHIVRMAAVAVSELTSSQKDELACSYAGLILKDQELEITAENITKIITAAGLKVESYWPTLFARLCKGKDLDALCSFGGGGGGGGAAPAAGGDAGGAPAAAAAAPVEEEEEEEMDFDLFG